MRIEAGASISLSRDTAVILVAQTRIEDSYDQTDAAEGEREEEERKSSGDSNLYQVVDKFDNTSPN